MATTSSTKRKPKPAADASLVGSIATTGIGDYALLTKLVELQDKYADGDPYVAVEHARVVREIQKRSTERMVRRGRQ